MKWKKEDWKQKENGFWQRKQKNEKKEGKVEKKTKSN